MTQDRHRDQHTVSGPGTGRAFARLFRAGTGPCTSIPGPARSCPGPTRYLPGCQIQEELPSGRRRQAQRVQRRPEGGGLGGRCSLREQDGGVLVEYPRGVGFVVGTLGPAEAVVTHGGATGVKGCRDLTGVGGGGPWSVGGWVGGGGGGEKFNRRS